MIIVGESLLLEEALQLEWRGQTDQYKPDKQNVKGQENVSVNNAVEISSSDQRPIMVFFSLLSENSLHGCFRH